MNNLITGHSQPVTVSTVWKSKGLEADHVLIVDFRDPLFPDRRSLPDVALSVFYVAVTRAKRHLVVVDNPSGAWSQTGMLLDIVSSGAKRSPYVFQFDMLGWSEGLGFFEGGADV